MPNAAAHRLGAALVVGGASAYDEHRRGVSTAAPLGHAALAAVFGTLPDVLEPATNPHHRRLFHSIASGDFDRKGASEAVSLGN